ncbi:hypothetical protein L2X99_06465 [Microbacterium sp. KUDC0406]|uniref:hypothetical protein n=1 Tax=Microbacterium sp. KUDC0406 TaxID=2909588 RepID=UPI001F19A213|nr:hypothetical protein [Microbacterium sp. KUDC0406]UJP11197.1 hypothetical protein L2X99_06465 [Microbacterium sp. KUDC0406]
MRPVTRCSARPRTRRPITGACATAHGSGGGCSGGDRRSAARDLARIRSDIASASFNHMDASELRGHLAAIERLEAVREREWLHVDDGRVRIVYSFGIRTGVWDDPIGLVAALHEDAVAMRDAGRTIGGLDIVEARGRLDLSDVWQGTDNFGRGYRGATIRLADIRLERSDDGTPLETVHTRIQLSQLGNHSIVFDIDLHDAPAYRVAEAVHLATPVFGDLTEIDGMLRMRVSGDRTVSGLPEVVDDLLEGLRSMLDGIAGAVDGTRLAAREGSFGIVATIVAASRIGPHGSTALTDTRGLLDLWGVQPLVHPLPSGAASIADWALYDLDAVETWSLLHLNSELLASNSNVTLLAAFGSPDFAVQEMESYIEFAHSMHGMYQGWQDGVRYFAERIARLLSEAEIVLRRTDELDDRREYALSTQRAEAIADLDRLVREVERTELSLQAFVQSNEAIMLFIESPSMVTSPPLRTDLDTILDSNGYQHLRDGFTRAVRDVLGTRLQPLLEVVHRRMEHAYAAERALIEQQRRDLEEQAERQREDRDRRNGRVFEVLGIVFAVVGFSGIASVLQTGYPDWGGPVAWWLVAIVLALAAATGVALAVLSGRRILRRPAPDAERPEESDP